MPSQQIFTRRKTVESSQWSCLDGNQVHPPEFIINYVAVINALLVELHILVNNSGSNWGAPYDEYPDSAWTRVLTLNLHRVFTITQLLTPLLEKAATPGDPSRIINIGSIEGLKVPALETL